MVKNGASSHKTYYIGFFQRFQNPEEHQKFLCKIYFSIHHNLKPERIVINFQEGDAEAELARH